LADGFRFPADQPDVENGSSYVFLLCVAFVFAPACLWPVVVGGVVVVLVVEVVLEVVAAATATGGGSVPIGCDWQGVTPGDLAACVPANLETNIARFRASWPTTTFWGMIAPENPPFWIAYRTRVTGRSQRWSRFGPFVISAERMFDADP
jgi:hypothetical protein